MVTWIIPYVSVPRLGQYWSHFTYKQRQRKGLFSSTTSGVGSGVGVDREIGWCSICSDVTAVWTQLVKRESWRWPYLWPQAVDSDWKNRIIYAHDWNKHLSNGVWSQVIPWYPSGRAERGGWGEGGLGISSEIAGLWPGHLKCGPYLQCFWPPLV